MKKPTKEDFDRNEELAIRVYSKTFAELEEVKALRETILNLKAGDFDNYGYVVIFIKTAEENMSLLRRVKVVSEHNKNWIKETANINDLSGELFIEGCYLPVDCIKYYNSEMDTRRLNLLKDTRKWWRRNK